MRIEEFDECQGLTADIIQKWLVTNGWQQTKPIWWANGEDGFLFDPQTFDQQWFWLYALAAVHDLNIQGMLREINPRMRKGMPSERARKACALWLVRDTETGEIELHRTEGAALYSASDYMEFWPCDEHGNKVRWPTDENGDML